MGLLCAENSWARTRGAQLSAGYTVNTYSKPPMYDASKCGNVNGNALVSAAAAAALQKTSALAKPDVDLFIARTDTRQTRLTTSQNDSTKLKAGNCMILTSTLFD